MFPTFFSDDESTDVTMDDVVDDPAVDDSLDLTTSFVREYERGLEGRPDVPMALNLGWYVSG
jgi:hypothetical protein